MPATFKKKIFFGEGNEISLSTSQFSLYHCIIISSKIYFYSWGCAHRKRWKEENFFFIGDHMVCKYSNSCLRRVFVSEKDSSDSRNGSVCWWFLMQVYINEKQNFEIAVRFWKACLTMQNICCFPSKGFYIQYLL